MLEDSPLLSSLETCKEIYYHSTCYIKYLKKYDSTLEKLYLVRPRGIWHQRRDVHKAAFEALSALIVREIVEKEEIFFLVDLNSHYKALLLEFSDDEFPEEDWEDYKADYLQDKILEAFGDVIMIASSNAIHQKRIVHNIDIDVSRLVNDSAIRDTSEAKKVDNIAYKLRNSVKRNEARKRSHKLQAGDITDAECDVPVIMFKFMCNLIQGPDVRRRNAEDNIKIESLCHNIINMISCSTDQTIETVKLELDYCEINCVK